MARGVPLAFSSALFVAVPRVPTVRHLRAGDEEEEAGSSSPRAVGRVVAIDKKT